MTIRKEKSNMTQLVSYKKEDGIAVITINNPPLNVFGQQVREELEDIIIKLETDQEVVCVVLNTTGNKAFVAGADIKEFPTMIGNPAMRANVMAMHNTLNKLDNLPKPTIVVLDGITLGGGCELALAFDIRIAEEHAAIGFPEVNLGLFPGAGGTQRLPRLIGDAKTKEIMYTGESITADAAERIGLVYQVVPSGEGLETAMNLGTQIASKSLQSLSRIKTAIDEGLEKNLSEGIDK